MWPNVFSFLNRQPILFHERKQWYIQYFICRCIDSCSVINWFADFTHPSFSLRLLHTKQFTRNRKYHRTFCNQICHDTVNYFCATGAMLIYRQLVEKLLWLNRLSSLYHWLSTQQFLRRQTLVRSLPPNCQDSQINGTASHTKSPWLFLHFYESLLLLASYIF